MNAHQVNAHGLPGVIYLQARGESGADTSVSLSVDRAADWTVVEVEGEMDVQVIPLLADLVGGDATRVVLDLHGVSFMDAQGLGSMVDTHRRALAAGGSVRLVAPSSSVRRLLALTGCDRMFRTFDSLDQAVTTPIDTGLEPVS